MNAANEGASPAVRGGRRVRAGRRRPAAALRAASSHAAPGRAHRTHRYYSYTVCKL